jgi:hypothetical protein
MLAGWSGRLRSNFLLGSIAWFAALVVTISIFNPLLFVHLFIGRQGEAMMVTLPFTLLGAPGDCVVIWLVLMKLVDRRIASQGRMIGRSAAHTPPSAFRER